MNKPSEQIKAMTKKLFKARSGTLSVKKLHPKRDWMIGILIGFCIAAAVISWSVYVYTANRDGGTTETEVVVVQPSYQAALVDQALKIFEARSANFSLNGTAIVTSTEDVVDRDTVVDTAPMTATSTETSSTVSEADEMIAVPENETNQETDVGQEDEFTAEESSLGVPTVNQ